MRKLIVVILVFFSTVAHSQRFRGFGGVSLYLDRAFDTATFGNAAVGGECKLNQTFRPEIEVGVFYGSLKTRSNTNLDGILIDEKECSFVATNITFCPKICLADEADENNILFFQILPTYSITKVMAQGSLFTVDQNDVSKSTFETDRYSEIRHSFGIGIGVYMNLSKKYNNSLALNLYYNGIDFGNSFSNLEFGKSTKTKTNDVLGLGLKFYFAFTKRKE